MTELVRPSPTDDPRRRELSRQAAAEGIGDGNGWGRLHPPRHPSKKHLYLQGQYKAFVERARAWDDDEAIVAAACSAPAGSRHGEATDEEVEKEVRRWVHLMHEAEQSTTQIATGPAAATIQGYAARGAELAKLYRIHQDDEKTILLVPRHILAWTRHQRVPFKAVDRRKPKDSDTVLEVFCGIYHPNGEKNEALKALNAARAIVHGEKQ